MDLTSKLCQKLLTNSNVFFTYSLSNSEDIVDYEKLAMEEMIQIEGYISKAFSL